MKLEEDPSIAVSHKKLLSEEHFEASSSLVRSLPCYCISKFDTEGRSSGGGTRRKQLPHSFAKRMKDNAIEHNERQLMHAGPYSFMLKSVGQFVILYELLVRYKNTYHGLYLVD